MRLVLDANILLSLMNPDSCASYLFSSLRAEFLAPLYVKVEMDEHKSEFLTKSKLSRHEFEIRLAEIGGRISFVGASEFDDLPDMCDDLLPDREDSQYLALALLTKSPIWSNDSHLKQQSLVKVFTTKELIDKLLGEEL